MKYFKLMRVACVALVCFVLLGGVTLSSLADTSNVEFVGFADEFIFTPENKDLFTNFKKIVPGDELTQDIIVKNSYKEKVKIYMRAEPVSEQDAAFLSELNMKVELKSGDQVNALYNGSAAELISASGSLKEDVLLGEFPANANCTITATLSAPLDMGNEFQAASGDIVWVFTVNEAPGEIPPSSGDENLVLKILPFLAAALIIVIIIIIIRNRRRLDGADDEDVDQGE